MKIPRRLFRRRERVPEFSELLWRPGDPAESTGFVDMIRGFSRSAQDELGRLPEEVGTLLLMLLYSRSCGADRVRMGGIVFDLDDDCPRTTGRDFDNLPASIQAEWDRMGPIGGRRSE